MFLELAEDKKEYAIYITFLLYQKIIFREFNLKDNDGNDYDYQKIYDNATYNIIIAKLDQLIKDEKINLNKKIGTFIDNNVILSAYASGSLFIRKCYDNSLIHLYSDVLKTCKYNNKISGDSKPTLKTTPQEWDISHYSKYLKYKSKQNNLEDKYFKKYLLYKNKYLKLSKHNLD